MPARRLLVVVLGAAAVLLPAGASGEPKLPRASVTPVIYGTQGANGWYVTNVTVNWVIEPVGYLGTEGCQAITFVTDTPGTTVSCRAWWADGTDITVRKPIYRDATAPTVNPVPDRPPDANGWYNHALAIRFSGTDVISGLDACSQATYAGPDSPSASVAGFCRDRAGNVGPASTSLKYDATPPVLGAFSAKPANQKAHLRWKAPDDAASVQLVRAPGLNGAAESVVFTGTALSKGYVDRGLRPGRNYVYRLTAADAAANQASKTLEFLARGALLFPAPGERVTRPPLLVWEKARGASYYNVILIRGRRYKLRPGTYSWYVWPGRGPLSAGRYGKSLGGSTFTFGGSG